MTWKTHILGGMQAGMLLVAVTNAEPKVALMEVGIATLGSVLPDIDQSNSKISRSDLVLNFISKQLSKVTKHRREVHTVWASFLFALLCSLFLLGATSASATGFSFLAGIIIAIIIDLLGFKIGIPMGILAFFMLPQFIKISVITLDTKLILPLCIALFLGCLSHLVYDTFNLQGIMWLHPFKKKRYKLAKIQTTSQEELFFRIVMILITIILFLSIRPFGTEPIYEIFNYKEIFTT